MSASGSWWTVALQTAEAVAPVAKAGLMYKPSKQEKAYRESLEARAAMLNQGTAQGEGVRQQQLATGRGQVEAMAQQQQAEIARGGQGNLATSGQQGQALLDTYAQKQGAQAQNLSQVNVKDSEMMHQAYQEYQLGLQRAAAMEMARRQAAMGELDKLSVEQIQEAYGAGYDMKTQKAGEVDTTADQLGSGTSASTSASTSAPKTAPTTPTAG